MSLRESLRSGYAQDKLRPSAERYGSLNRFCSQGLRPGLGSFVPLSGTRGQEIHYACPILAGRKSKSLRRGVYPEQRRRARDDTLGAETKGHGEESARQGLYASPSWGFSKYPSSSPIP